LAGDGGRSELPEAMRMGVRIPSCPEAWSTPTPASTERQPVFCRSFPGARVSDVE